MPGWRPSLVASWELRSTAELPTGVAFRAFFLVFRRTCGVVVKLAGLTDTLPVLLGCRLVCCVISVPHPAPTCRVFRVA